MPSQGVILGNKVIGLILGVSDDRIGVSLVIDHKRALCQLVVKHKSFILGNKVIGLISGDSIKKFMFGVLSDVIGFFLSVLGG